MTASKLLQPEKKVANFMLVGVGGQGTILASNILAEVGLKLGYDVKKAEVHGMSQRGGSVTSYVRWGKEVFSPIVAKGEVDVFVAFEKLEAIRFSDYLSPDGLVLVNDHSIAPITVSAGSALYPEDEAVRAGLPGGGKGTHWVNGLKIAEKLGNAKAANVVVLGALSALLEMEADTWLEVIEARVPPKFIELNRNAFDAGREAIAVKI